MIVISVPLRLRLATMALFLCVPLVALEVAIVARVPWWRVPLKNVFYWSFAYTLICIPLSSWLLMGKRWAYHLANVLAFLWLLASVVVAFRLRLPALGFFNIFLLLYLMSVLFWLKIELERAFFDPQMAWYQGAPKPIPGVVCQLKGEDQEIHMRASRIDQEGAFVFASSVVPLPAQKSLPIYLRPQKLQLTFSFRDRKLQCEGIPTRALENGKGIGIRFVELTSDLKKEVSDFVESLKVEGWEV